MASLLDLVKHLQQGIEQDADDENKVLKYIDQLYHLDVKVQHLQETGVGRTVNALRKEPGVIGHAARSLVYKWKLMVANESSDQEDDHESAPANGHSNGKDSDDNNANLSRHREDHRPNTSRTDQPHRQKNGDTSGSKKRSYSSEDEEPNTKKSKHSSSSDSDNKNKTKYEQTESDSQESESSMSDSESEISEEEKYGKVKIKEEPIEICSSPSKYSSVSIKSEPSSSKTQHNDYDKHSKHSSVVKSSKERSHSSNEKTYKESPERRHRSEHRSMEREGTRKEESRSSSKHSDKHKSNSQKSESSEKLKNKLEKSDKDKHSSSHKSNKEKEKQKSSSEKEISDKHRSKSSSSKDKSKESSSSKEKSRESSGSSKEKAKDSTNKDKAKESSNSKDKSSSHKSKESSANDKKRSDSKNKLDKSDNRSSEKKSSHKSSSRKSKSSSSKSNEDIPKKKVQIDDSDDGIDCGSGASFAEALGMIIPAKTKKKSQSTPSKDDSSIDSRDLSPASLLSPSAKLAPLPALEISALPEISPNYKPRPPPKFLPHFSDDDAMNHVISSKNQRTKVYSGNKIYGKVPSLYEMCVQVLQEHIDALEYTGGVPYEILKPVVDKATPQQLFMLEHYNAYLMEDTDHLWQKFCEKNFRNKRRQEMETWREMYMRCQEEQEHKLKSLTANIRLTQEAKKAPIKQTKMAYVDTVVKPPRNILKKQAQHGTAFAASASPAARVAALAAAPNVLKTGAVRPPTGASVSSSSFKPKKAPLMQKALQFMRGRKR